MPDTKITALTAISTVDPAVDVLPIVDVSDTTMAASGTTKKITSNQILGAGGTATLASATITGDLTVDTSTLKVDSANNRVGIGTASPAYPLDVNGAIQTTSGSVAGLFQWSFGASASSRSWRAWNDVSANGDFQISTSTTRTGSTYSDRYRIDVSGVHEWSNTSGLAMTLNSTGLGVGGSPNFKLDVAGAANSAPITLLRLNNIGTTGGGPGIAARLQFNAGATALGFVQGCNFASGSIGVQISGDGTNIHQTIDSSGNVGIGVTPSAWGGLGTGPGVLQMGNAGCSLLAGGAGFSGTNQFFISNNAYYNATGGSSFKYYRAGGGAAQYSQVGNEHQWKVSSNTPVADTAITFTQAMTLDASGNLLVGKTANYGTGETQTLQLKSSVIFGSDNTGSASNRNWSIGTNASAAGSMEWTISSTNTGWPNFAYRMQLTSAGAAYNTTGTWGTISDSRLKENISDARNYLADLLKLRVVKYSLKEEASAVATKLGLIAQEVEQVFPSLVEQSDVAYEGGEGIRTVKTSILVPMLLKAIQELTARVQTLETR